MKRYNVNGTLRVLSDDDAKRLGLDPADGTERGKGRQQRQPNKARTAARTHKKEQQQSGSSVEPGGEPQPEIEDEPVIEEPDGDKGDGGDAINKARRTRQA